MTGAFGLAGWHFGASLFDHGGIAGWLNMVYSRFQTDLDFIGNSGQHG